MTASISNTNPIDSGVSQVIPGREAIPSGRSYVPVSPGNVRAVVKGDHPNSVQLLQENHYYPFGKIMANMGSTFPSGDLKATLIASQLPVANWYEIIGEEIFADAILDRLVHTSHRIELKGESLWKKL